VPDVAVRSVAKLVLPTLKPPPAVELPVDLTSQVVDADKAMHYLSKLIRWLLDGRSVEVSTCPGCGVPPGWLHVVGCRYDLEDDEGPIPWDGRVISPSR
jgi:hypothetical protein